MGVLDQQGLRAPSFKNADQAFNQLYRKIQNTGLDMGNGTKGLHNVAFYILNPMDNHIKTEFRKWNPKYADREWAWYVSQDRSVKELKKYAPIWDQMHGGDDIVNSNYGWQWNRNFQLKKVIDQLRKTPTTRQAWVSIYDGKEKDMYEFDTPCTIGIGFRIVNGKLNMSVLMRSNDLWYGFCNDQYCFSNLMRDVADALDIAIGSYYHYTADMHIYNDRLVKSPWVNHQ